RIAIDMSRAIEADKTDHGLRTAVTAAAANHHRARLIVVHAEMRQFPPAFRADQPVAAPEVGFDALVGTAEMMDVLLFAQLRRTAFRAFLAHMHARRAAAVAEVEPVEEFPLQKAVLALFL